MRAGRDGGLLEWRRRPVGALAALAVGGLLAASVAGCGGGSAANTPADQSFVAAVHLSAPDIASFRSDTQLTRIGHAVCDGFRAGAGFQEVADRMSLLEGRNPLPSQDLGVLVRSAVNAYCPQFRSQV